MPFWFGVSWFYNLHRWPWSEQGYRTIVWKVKGAGTVSLSFGVFIR
jgi:hypothetical protein